MLPCSGEPEGALYRHRAATTWPSSVVCQMSRKLQSSHVNPRAKAAEHQRRANSRIVLPSSGVTSGSSRPYSPSKHIRRFLRNDGDQIASIVVLFFDFGGFVCRRCVKGSHSFRALFLCAQR